MDDNASGVFVAERAMNPRKDCPTVTVVVCF